jgi:Tfp pilus assembly protein PilF
MKAVVIAVASVATFFFSQATVCAADEQLNQAIACYNEHHYQSARHFLESCTVSDPANAVAHYYLANTLVQLHEYALAKKHYGLCCLLQPNGTYGRYACMNESTS